MGFYWNYMLLLKPPVLMHSCFCLRNTQKLKGEKENSALLLCIIVNVKGK